MPRGVVPLNVVLAVVESKWLRSARLLPDLD